MKANLKGLLLGAGCLLAAGVSAMATPFQRGDLPADTAWVIHIDCDLLRTGTVGQFLQGELSKPEVQSKLAAVQAMFSFDLQKQLHGLTLYSASLNPKDGVLLIYGDFDAERLLTLAKGAEDYQGINHGQRVIHTWIDQNKTDHSRIYAALQGGRLVFGQREATVATALDVLDGAVASLATEKSFPQLGGPGSASSIQGAARKLDLPASDANALLLRLSKQVRLEIGETQGVVNSTLTLEAGDETVAGQMASVAQGLVALGRLANKPELTRLLEAISIKQDGLSVVGTLKLPATDVVDMMKADAARKAARKAQAEAQEK
jgi:hypothetical protein